MNRITIFPDDVTFGDAELDGQSFTALILSDAGSATEIRALFFHEDVRDNLYALRNMLNQIESRLKVAN